MSPETRGPCGLCSPGWAASWTPLFFIRQHMLNHRGHECDSKPFLTWDSSRKGMFPPVYHLGDSEGMRRSCREDQGGWTAGTSCETAKHWTDGNYAHDWLLFFFWAIRYVGS